MPLPGGIRSIEAIQELRYRRAERGLPPRGGRRFGIVAGRFYEQIVTSLVDAAVATLREAGVRDEDITVLWVGGAVEIPLLCQRLGRSGGFDSLLAIGCVIRGGTPHFDYVCDMVAQGVNRVSLDEDIPIAFGVLTCDNAEQAYARSGLPTTEPKSKGNKGEEAAQAALEMVSLLSQLQE